MQEAPVRPMDRVLPTSADPWAQELLEQRSLSFERKTIPFNLIDRESSLRNQARINPINNDTVDIYAAAMLEGQEFPPIVVSGLGGKFVVLDGNHRVQAGLRAGFTHIDAYIVTSGSRASIELFTFEANTRHGLPTSLEERTRQGMYLVSLGNTPTDVARALGLPLDRFRGEVTIARQRQRLATLSVDTTRLSRTLLDRIASVRNDNAAKAVANLVLETGLGSDGITDLIGKVNRQGTEDTQLRAIEVERKRWLPLIRSTAGGKLSLPRNVNRIVMAIRLVDNIETAELEAQLRGLDKEFRTLIARDSAAAVQKFVEVLTAMKKADTE